MKNLLIFSISAEKVPYEMELNKTAARMITDMDYCNGTYVAVGSAGTIFASDDTVNWQEINPGTYYEIDSIVTTDDRFLAYNQREVFISSDGYNWERFSTKSFGYHDIVALDDDCFGIESVTGDYTTKDFQVLINIDGKEERELRSEIHQKAIKERFNQDIRNIKYGDYTFRRASDKGAEAGKLYCTNSEGEEREIILFDNSGYIPVDGKISWTGKAFIKYTEEPVRATTCRRQFFSYDRENWQEITLPHSPAFGTMVSYWGDRYIIKESYSHGANFYFAEQIQKVHWHNYYVYAYDEDFNLINEGKTDVYPIEMSYSEGLYYYRDYDNNVYTSTDLIDWQLDNNTGKMPITYINDVRKAVKLQEYTYNLQEREPTFTKVINDTEVPVLYEKMAYNADYLGEFYYYYTTNGIMLSRDGIYYTLIELPIAISYQPYELNGRFCIDIADWHLSFDLNDIYAALPPENTPYVKVNGRVLAFDTPPVIEDDRIFVPMRFIFENMDAEVEWDNWVSEASVTKEGNNITFAIGSNKAVVNGKTEKMDVSARNVNSRTMIPLRFLSENLGYKVTWDQENKTAYIEN